MKNINFKLTLLLIAGFLISGCGFKIIYKTDKDNASYAAGLAAIEIIDVRSHINQQLKNDLLDVLNYDNIKVEPKYLLSLSISETISPTFINFTGSSGRNHMVLTVKYELKDIKTLEIIANGDSFVSDDFNIDKRRFGNYTAEEHIRLNLLKLIAENIRSLLVKDLIEIAKKDGRGGEIRTPDPLVPNQMR